MRELAFIHRLWNRVGFNRKNKRAVLRGPIVTGKKKFNYDPLTKELLLSSYHTDDEHFFSYYEEIKRRNIKYLHAHISSAVTFANFLIKKKLKLPLKAVLGASENVFSDPKATY